MFKIVKSMLLLLSLVVLTGCTHKISVTPDMSDVEIDNKSIKEYNVGYYLSDADSQKHIVTAGGGGDKIGYYLYKDLEHGFRTVLLNNFNRVYKVKSLNDNSYIKDKDLKFIFTYNLGSVSSSDSAFTWPPTNFIITLDSKAVNSKGQIVWSDKVTGNGNATFDEFKSDFALAGKRAAKDALVKMMERIEQSNKF